MIEYYFKKKNESKVRRIKSYQNGCWINVTNPNKEELDFLVKEFKLSEPNLIDGLDIHENPRFEIEGRKNYIYLTAPTNKIKQEYDSSFLIIYAKDYFMTVSKYSLEIFEKILDPKVKFETFDNSRNIVKILFVLSRMFEKSIHRILKETKENKASLNQLTNSDIERLINHEDKINNYIGSFGSTIATYQKILRDKSLGFLKREEVIIEDLIIDLNETLNLGKQTLKTISNMRGYYSTKLSNDLNKTVKTLTLVTIFLSIPTLISSIYGMNIKLPIQESGYILPILAGVASAISAAFFLILRKKNML